MPFALVNGTRLNYQICGKGPPIVLTHGFQSSMFVWTPVLDSLAKRFQVISWDLRGHGDSEKPAGPYRIQNFSDDLLGLLDALKLDKANLIGHSMGGRTSVLFAMEHGDRLDRLMLVAASAGAPSGAYRERFESLLRIAQEEGMEAVLAHRLTQGFIPPALREGPFAEEYRERYLKNTPETYTATANALFTMPDLTGRLGEISSPTWICYGENDAGPLTFNEIFLKRIPDCSGAIIPGSDHFPMWDNTDTFLSKLDSFLGKGMSRSVLKLKGGPW